MTDVNYRRIAVSSRHFALVSGFGQNT